MYEVWSLAEAWSFSIAKEMCVSKAPVFFKKWREIAAVKDDNLRLALSTLDPDTFEGRRVMANLPMYFSTEPQSDSGPFSLAAMRQKAKENGLRQHVTTQGAERVSSYDAVPAGLPVFSFSFTAEYDEYHDHIPDEIQRQLTRMSRQGDKLRWKGKEFVILELSLDEVFVAPAELVRVDI